MKKQIIAFTIAILSTFAFTVNAAPITATAAPSKVEKAALANPDLQNIAVTLTTATGQTLEGVLSITRFITRKGGILAIGNLTVDGVTKAVALPVLINDASCTILDLSIGAIDLNLLGLRVQLDPINLLITAIPSDGLLGQLLCGIAGLLDGLNLGALTNLLNQLLGQL